jgi:hypothetical protein
VVGRGYNATIDVLVENQGLDLLHLDVSVYYDANLVETRELITLNPGAFQVLTFEWNTMGIPKGSYTIAATMPILPCEINKDDNTYIDGTVTVTIPGDVDGDFYVGSVDAGVLNGAYGTSYGDPLYVPEADIDCDGYIGSADAGILNGNYGMTDP